MPFTFLPPPFNQTDSASAPDAGEIIAENSTDATGDTGPAMLNLNGGLMVCYNIIQVYCHTPNSCFS